MNQAAVARPRARVALWKWAILPLMSAVIVLCYTHAGPAPAFTSPESARIIFWHVPMAILSMIWFFFAAFLAIQYLRTRDLKYDLRAAEAASVGLALTVLATLTGAIFSKMQWAGGLKTPWYQGYWQWDPKQTAILVVILIFGAYFGLRGALDEPRQRAQLASTYAVLGALMVPLLYYTLPHLPIFGDTLHPTEVINRKQGMSPEYRLVFWLSTLTFLGLSCWCYDLRTRLGLLQQRRAAVPAS